MLLSHSFTDLIFNSWENSVGYEKASGLGPRYVFLSVAVADRGCIQATGHFSSGTPANLWHSHNPLQCSSPGLTIATAPGRNHCSPKPGCRPGDTMNQISPNSTPKFPPIIILPPALLCPLPSSPATRARTIASRHLWGEDGYIEGLLPQRRQIALPDHAQNSLAPPHIHAHLNSRRDTFVNLPGESQVVRKNRDWINRPVSGPTLLHRMLRNAYAQQGACAAGVRALQEHTAHAPAFGTCSAGWGFPTIEARVLEPQGLWRMRKGLEDYIFSFSAVFLRHPHTVVIGSPRLPLVENVSLKDSHERHRYYVFNIYFYTCFDKPIPFLILGFPSYSQWLYSLPWNKYIDRYLCFHFFLGALHM